MKKILIVTLLFITICQSQQENVSLEQENVILEHKNIVLEQRNIALQKENAQLLKKLEVEKAAQKLQAVLMIDPKSNVLLEDKKTLLAAMHQKLAKVFSIYDATLTKPSLYIYLSCKIKPQKATIFGRNTKFFWATIYCHMVDANKKELYRYEKTLRGSTSLKATEKFNRNKAIVACAQKIAVHLLKNMPSLAKNKKHLKKHPKTSEAIVKKDNIKSLLQINNFLKQKEVILKQRKAILEKENVQLQSKPKPQKIMPSSSALLTMDAFPEDKKVLMTVVQQKLGKLFSINDNKQSLFSINISSHVEAKKGKMFGRDLKFFWVTLHCRIVDANKKVIFHYQKTKRGGVLFNATEKVNRSQAIKACAKNIMDHFFKSVDISSDKKEVSFQKENKKVFMIKKDLYPSAHSCRSCHEQIYREWAGSAHAYAAISPMFHKFEQKIASMGKQSSFCIRCHISVGSALGEASNLALAKRHETSLQGVTCISCHRVHKQPGTTSIVPGSVYSPVYGNTGGDGIAQVIKNKKKYQVTIDEKNAGVPMHVKGIKLDLLSKSEFCSGCHQQVWQQYQPSVAKKKGISCQECHMGKEPGHAKGFATGPMAIFSNGEIVNAERQHSNHSFYGLGFSFVSPGIFPLNANQFSHQAWKKFNVKAGWGTDDFEEKVEAGKIKVDFPPEWQEADDRYDARDIVDDGYRSLEQKKSTATALLNQTTRIEGPYLKNAPQINKKLLFEYKVKNLNIAHNLPAASPGIGPALWLKVVLLDPTDKIIWRSDYLDMQGNMRDVKFTEERKTLDQDSLFHLQTKFFSTGMQMYLPAPLRIDKKWLRFKNAATLPYHPPFAGLQGQSIPPASFRSANYHIPALKITKKGTYKLQVQLCCMVQPGYIMQFLKVPAKLVQEIKQQIISTQLQTFKFKVK